MELCLSEARALVAFFGGSNASVTVREFPERKEPDGRVFPAGKYAWCTDYPEEGAVWLGAHDPDADVEPDTAVTTANRRAAESTPDRASEFLELPQALRRESDPAPCFTEPMEALAFLSGRFKYAGVSQVVGESYARDIDAILERHSQARAQSQIATELQACATRTIPPVSPLGAGIPHYVFDTAHRKLLRAAAEQITELERLARDGKSVLSYAMNLCNPLASNALQDQAMREINAYLPRLKAVAP